MWRQWEDWDISFHAAASLYWHKWHLQDGKDEHALNNLLYLDCADRETLCPAWVSPLSKKERPFSRGDCGSRIHTTTLAKIVIISRLESFLLRAVPASAQHKAVSALTHG